VWGSKGNREKGLMILVRGSKRNREKGLMILVSCCVRIEGE
jgi:hypothetical protein